MPAQIEENDRFFVSGAGFKGKVNDGFDGMGGVRSRNDTFGSGKEEARLRDIYLRIGPSLYVAKVVKVRDRRRHTMVTQSPRMNPRRHKVMP